MAVARSACLSDAFAHVAPKKWSLQAPEARVDGPNHLIVYTPKRLLKHLWVRIIARTMGTGAAVVNSYNLLLAVMA